LLKHMSRELVRDVGSKSRQFFELVLPPADVFEDGSDLVIIVDMPGFEKDQIKTRLNESAFTVTAKRDPVERDGISYFEQRPLRLSKRIALPVKVETGDEEVKGKYENGVLTVRLPVKGVGRVILE
jgi:HSP20 family protein